MDMPEIDPNFEPQLRARSNTWPVRPKDLTEDESARISSSVTTSADGDRDVEVQEKHSEQGLIHNKKAGGSRRNAWGNLSYADLITKAIQSSPEQRLTLSQIYDWMVQNVPYFSDKGDSNSSAGWKVLFFAMGLFIYLHPQLSSIITCRSIDLDFLKQNLVFLSITGLYSIISQGQLSYKGNNSITSEIVNCLAEPRRGNALRGSY